MPLGRGLALRAHLRGNRRRHRQEHVESPTLSLRPFPLPGVAPVLHVRANAPPQSLRQQKSIAIDDLFRVTDLRSQCLRSAWLSA